MEIVLYDRELMGDRFGVDACSGPDNATCGTAFNCSVAAYRWPQGSSMNGGDRLSQVNDSTCDLGGTTARYWRLRFPCAGGSDAGWQPYIYSAQFHSTGCQPSPPPSPPPPSPPPSPPPPGLPPTSPPPISPPPVATVCAHFNAYSDYAQFTCPTSGGHQLAFSLTIGSNNQGVPCQLRGGWQAGLLLLQ